MTRILLVEDDRDIRESLVDALSDEGHEVSAAIDGIDALAQLRNGHAAPDLILLDLMMPRMSGEQFCEELKQVPAWSAIPVVVITAQANARARVAALGAAGFLQKPVKLGDLIELAGRYSPARAGGEG